MTIYEEINNAIREQKSVVLCTIVETNGSVPRHEGSKMLVYTDGKTIGTVGGGEVEAGTLQKALSAFKDGKTRLLTYKLNEDEKESAGLCGGTVKIYVEPILQASQVVIVGAGHVGRAVAHLAKWLNFHVFVSDDRVELCDPANVPEADAFLPIAMEEIPSEININTNTYFVLVTRGSEVDIKGLPSLLKTDAGYIGLIGSRKRWAHTRKMLVKEGVSEENIARIKTPIGLSIGAETPQEIAMSIMTEIIGWRNSEK